MLCSFLATVTLPPDRIYFRKLNLTFFFANTAEDGNYIIEKEGDNCFEIIELIRIS